MDKFQLIKHYFLKGFTYEEIRLCLSSSHDIHVSISHIKVLAKQLNLSRRLQDVDTIVDFISDKLNHQGNGHGYRWMHMTCIQNGISVGRETVREVMGFLDPEGTDQRRRTRLRRRIYSAKGPNYIWHIDSYDKLSRFGICINAAIDGFSRFVLWAECNYTNSNPRVISSYYLKTVERLSLCPFMMRGDLGTENGDVATMQYSFRNHAQNAFIYGTSQHNQRIESWWGILRTHCIQYWIDLFEEMKENNQFSGEPLDKGLLQFCFMDLVQVNS